LKLLEQEPFLKESSKARPRGSAILRVLGTLLALGLLIYVLREQGWEDIKSAVGQIDAWRLGLALLVMIISRLAVSGRWYVLLRSGGAEITPSQSFQVTFAGLFANNFLPTTVGGDVIRLAGALRLRCDTAVAAASLIADRLIGMAGMLMAVPFGLPRLMLVKDLRELIPTDTRAVQTGLAVLPFGNLFTRIWEKALGILHRLLSTLSLWLKQPRALGQALGFTWINMLCLFIVLKLFFDGMGQSIPFWIVGGLYSFVYLIALIPISINGYGLQEISMTLVFTHLGGASLASSLTAALLFRTTMMVTSLPGALFVPGLMAYRRQRQDLDKPSLAE
jgi:uncharacterized membrane protein YbhN (UPF0104 family)